MVCSCLHSGIRSSGILFKSVMPLASSSRSLSPGKERIVYYFFSVHEAESHQPVRLNHEKCAYAGVVLFGGTVGIIEPVNSLQGLEVRLVHISLLLLHTGAGKGECRIPEHREIIPV